MTSDVAVVNTPFRAVLDEEYADHRISAQPNQELATAELAAAV